MTFQPSALLQRMCTLWAPWLTFGVIRVTIRSFGLGFAGLKLPPSDLTLPSDSTQPQSLFSSPTSSIYPYSYFFLGDSFEISGRFLSDYRTGLLGTCLTYFVFAYSFSHSYQLNQWFQLPLPHSSSRQTPIPSYFLIHNRYLHHAWASSPSTPSSCSHSSTHCSFFWRSWQLLCYFHRSYWCGLFGSRGGFWGRWTVGEDCGLWDLRGLLVGSWVVCS